MFRVEGLGLGAYFGVLREGVGSSQGSSTVCMS